LVASLADSLWHRNRTLAEAALEHPFVQGIASGELAPATFAYYVGQDAAFLDAFCRAYALALAKSPAANVVRQDISLELGVCVVNCGIEHFDVVLCVVWAAGAADVVSTGPTRAVPGRVESMGRGSRRGLQPAAHRPHRRMFD
jgi:pyrroloquinoline quinone (PQQ) biosynthesis protein C